MYVYIQSEIVSSIDEYSQISSNIFKYILSAY